MEIRAELRHLHIAPRKVRLVAHIVVGMRVEDAARELRHRIKRAGEPLAKLLQSAVANAKHNFLVGDAVMRIKEFRVDPGPVSKRFRPRAFGRAAPIRRRTSHVVLVLATEDATGAVSGSRKSRITAAPILREATREDVRENADAPRGRGDADAGRGLPSKPRQGKFMRRMFQRKAI